MQQGTLSGKVALVTGSSRGIGRAIALKLAEAGAHVFINYQNGQAKAQEVADTINSLKSLGKIPSSAKADLCQFSVADSSAVDTAINGILAAAGGIHILVNNAGVARDALVMRMKEAEWDETVNTNLKGAFLCSRAVTRSMMKAREGSIINISSVVGEMGNAGQAAYAASKAGLLGLTKSMAKELASRNVRVNAVTPGFITTEMTAQLPEGAKIEMLRNIPMGAMGAPETIAEAVLWLASPASSYVTGQVLGVNGGLYM